MKWMKRLLMVAVVMLVLVIGGLGYLYFLHGYHGGTAVAKDIDDDSLINGLDDDLDGDGTPNLQDEDADGDGHKNLDEVVGKAEELTGTLYDPLKGGFGNVGGEMGFIVCIDVPRIAFAEAGIYFKDLLTKDFEAHPEHYDTQNGMNTPATPYFFRRVRNIYDFAKGNEYFIEKAETPKVGDIVLYSRYHATLVVAVYDDGTYDEVEAHPDLIFVKKHQHKKWQPQNVARILQ